MKIIYIDMDGVLSNFDNYYFKDKNNFVYDEFKYEVMNNNLFINLPPMFQMELFFKQVESLANEYNYNIEILSSTHTLKRTQANESKRQKTKEIMVG